MYLKDSYERGKLSQAYLFSGPQGTGKFDLAIDFAKMVNNLTMDSEKIIAKENPDIFIIRPEVEEKKGKRKERDISIDQIKEVLPNIGLYAYQGPYKFLIIDRADRLTVTASNSLLKLIEEPPTDTCIIFTTFNEEGVLPTIRSRCQRIRFGLLTPELIVKHLTQAYPQEPEKTVKLAAELSRGRIKTAVSYVESHELLSQRQQMVEEFRKALKAGVGKGFELSSQLATDKKQLLDSMEEWVWYLNRFQLKLAKEGADIRIQKKTLQILKELLAVKQVIEKSNANEKLQLENYFIKIT